jgi:AraC-like DNA-binding protein/quercetin dioxygenase-like cupin family protein|tara:strand:+ start:1774 stop:2619 length:846 start_codon:yes stop_codon:yes gene_type:complete
MKVLPFTIPKPKRDSLILQENFEPEFYGLLHQHEEFQISYIIAGAGTLIVGDSIHNYEEGDVFIFDENLPHVFKSDSSKIDFSHMKTIFFTKAAFGRDFFEIEELKPLLSFFKKAENGFKVLSNKRSAHKIFENLFITSKLDRFILFFQLLKVLKQSKIEPLSSFISDKKYSDNEGRRMSAVLEFTMNHFQKEITLDTISQEAAMTKNAFCKYFKKRTNKTYMTFLNELRIEEASKLLQVQKDLSITEIAEACGFQNISNFNRKFRRIKGKTPRDFRKILV